ncbi:ParB/RepB/Spo0J family partition protein [Micromonospora aurantiaca (nom. illeg.)]|uniref:ParB/RepB/Spo0J family partition protein n=1 Tax=Micromonospora aurantiaca (nom. illeg.) TaxID=47850 RepID=UPI001656D28B|nr:ParB/RepB/Spo0J family partition protein [Micromonospora aurantiaca]MBC9000463.1 ParB/RepB/Spo0J family partition protein [Micromonospora aurantiaca]
MTVLASPPAPPDHALQRIPLDLIEPGPNDRGELADVAELAASLAAVGQLMPVLLEPLPDGRYQLLDGHRRHAAANLANLPDLMAVVRHRDESPIRRTVRQLTIQTHAQPFNPMAEARALHRLMFGENMSREAIAHLLGRNPAWVRDRISLVHLTPGEQRDVEAGRMSVREALFRLQNRRAMREGRAPTQEKRTAAKATTRSAGPGAAQGGTSRREQIVVLLADGATTDEIAAAFEVARSTVKTHLQDLYEHLGARNAAHAVHLAYQRGLLRGPACASCAPDKATAR